MADPPVDPWTVMGLSRGATQDEIKEQWRRLCKRHHPDLQPAHLRAASERHFKEISGAYRILISRGSSLAGYADFNAAAAAAASRHHPYSSGFRTAWAPGGAPPPRFSNGVVGAVLAIPLVITGMWMALTFGDAEPTSWRPHGFMAPPENPFLRDDMRPRVYSHWSKWRQQQAAKGGAGDGGAGLLPAAPAAAAAAGGAP